MRKFMSVFLVLGIVVVVSGCKTISKQTKENLAKPVDCSTARADIQALEAEKASVGKRLVSGVRSVMPTSVVLGLLGRDYKNRVQVATGKYNNDIEAKILEIKGACGLDGYGEPAPVVDPVAAEVAPVAEPVADAPVAQ